MHCFSSSNNYSSSPESGIVTNIHTVIYLETPGFSYFGNKSQCYHFDKLNEDVTILWPCRGRLVPLVPVTSSIKLENIKESKQDKDLAFSLSKIYQQMILFTLSDTEQECLSFNNHFQAGMSPR